MAKSEIEGMAELEKTIKRMGALPQKCVTTAARKGVRIALKDAKKNAPSDQGYLKRGIVLKGERSKIRGKKVYQVTMNAKMNDIFVKLSRKGKRSYYPASQEYGYQTRSGKYIPGFNYMKKSIVENKVSITREIVQVLSKEIDKLK